eukprot:jgi/Undpi1/6142/HiC_scaffold_20.g08627.m1
MTFSLTENFPFLALPLTLIALKVMYDLLHPVAFFALVAAGIGAYMFYAGNKSPAAQRTAKRAEATADSLIQELTQEEDRAKEDAAKKQAAKDKKAAAKQQQEAARKAAQAAKAAAAAAALAAAQEEENKARSAPPSKSKKQPKQPKKQQPKAPESEEESDDDADEILLRMAQLERQSFMLNFVSCVIRWQCMFWKGRIDVELTLAICYGIALGWQRHRSMM